MISTFLFAPVTAIMFFFTFSWWGAIFFFLVIGWSTYSIYAIENDDFEFAALGLLILAIIGCLFLSIYFGPNDVGFFKSIGYAFKSALSGLGYYIIWGLIALPFLWFMDGRRFARRHKKAKVKFEELHSDGLSFDSDGDRWAHAKKRVRLYRDKPIDASTSEGAARIASLVFMWPIHILERALEDILREIPEFLSKMFGGSLNKISRLATGGEIQEGPPSSK